MRLKLLLRDLIQCFLFFYNSFIALFKSAKFKAKNDIKVVILGAGFAGRSVQDILSRQRGISITVVEPKDFIEYIPGILRCFVQPEKFAHLSVPLSETLHPSTKLLSGFGGEIQVSTTNLSAVSCPSGTINIYKNDGGCTPVEFDYLVISTGSTYPRPIKATLTDRELGVLSLDSRRKEFEGIYNALLRCEEIVILGGGPVGVELAAELVSVWPMHGTHRKNITIVTMGDRLLDTMDPSLGAAAETWLTTRGVRIIYKESLTDLDIYQYSSHETPLPSASPPGASDGSFAHDSSLHKPTVDEEKDEDQPSKDTASSGPRSRLPRAALGPGYAPGRVLLTSSGRKVQADYLFVCLGAKPISGWLHGKSPFSSLFATSVCSYGEVATTPFKETKGTVLHKEFSGDVPQPVEPLLPEVPFVLLPNGKIPVRETFQVHWKDQANPTLPATASSTSLSSSSLTSPHDVHAPEHALLEDAPPRPSPALPLSERIFAVGDVALHPSREPELAHTAEKHAHVVAQSILRMCAHEVPLRYPEEYVGSTKYQSPVISCVSLGPNYALLLFNKHALAHPLLQPLMGCMKQVIEVTKLWQLRNYAIGRLFWIVGDSLAVLTSNLTQCWEEYCNAKRD